MTFRDVLDPVSLLPPNFDEVRERLDISINLARFGRVRSLTSMVEGEGPQSMNWPSIEASRKKKKKKK